MMDEMHQHLVKLFEFVGLELPKFQLAKLWKFQLAKCPERIAGRKFRFFGFLGSPNYSIAGIG